MLNLSPPRLLIVGATGWYGKTLVHEYISTYGFKAALENLLLYASRPSVLSIDINDSTCELPVADFAEASHRSFDGFDGLIWYAFILKNKISVLGPQAYRDANQSIADRIFACLANNTHLRPTFFSSGAAYSFSERLNYESDPYAYLKKMYERELAKLGPLITFYPYATLGRYVPNNYSFAASSFLCQAITSNRIKIRAKMPIVRSYGSVHDFSRLLLRFYEIYDWQATNIPSRVVPVTHTLDLFQLAYEVGEALGCRISIVSSINLNSQPSIYTASAYSYSEQLLRFGITPTTLRQQLVDMSRGRAFTSSIENSLEDLNS